MKSFVFLSFLATLLAVSLSSCSTFGLKKKTVEYREKLQGYYSARIVERTYSTLPEPPSGVTSDIVREIKVEKGTADSTIIVDGMTFKLPSDEIYDYVENYTSVVPYNFTHLEFFSRNKKDSLTYVKSEGDAALYRTTVYSAAYLRGLK